MCSKMQKSELRKVGVEQLALSRIKPDSNLCCFVVLLEQGGDIVELARSTRKRFKRKASGLQSDGVSGRGCLVILNFSIYRRNLLDICGYRLSCTKSVVMIRRNGITQTQEPFLPVRLMTHPSGKPERHCRRKVTRRLAQ